MTASAWTDDRIGRLKTLWLEGRTAEQIARALANGITRNAVLGKVHRMGLSAACRAGSPKVAPKPGPAAAQRARPAVLAPRVAAPAVAEASPVPERGCATLQSVGRHECRWPLGDPLAAGFTLCGNRVARGAYCETHAKIAYRPVREMPQSLERLARLN